MNNIVTVGRGTVAAAVLAVLLGACGGPGSQPTSSPEPTATPGGDRRADAVVQSGYAVDPELHLDAARDFSVVPRAMDRSSGDRALDG